MIDYILVSKRWMSSISVCRSFSKPDVASDHQLVMAGVKIKLKTKHREAPVKRFDTEKLKDDIKNRGIMGSCKKIGEKQWIVRWKLWKRYRKRSGRYTMQRHRRC